MPTPENMSIETITPSLANAYLKNSSETKNRKINTSRVNRYASEMRLKKWKLTHQGILLGAGDCVIDGQHRLKAIVVSKIPQQMLVVRDPTITSPIGEPIDEGASRSGAFSEGVHHHIWEVASLLTLVATGQYDEFTFNTIGKTIRSITKQISDECSEIVSQLPSTHTNGLAIAPIRGAIVILSKLFPADHQLLIEEYRLFVGTTQTQLSVPVSEFKCRYLAQIQQRDRKTAKAAFRSDMGRVIILARALRAFESMVENEHSGRKPKHPRIRNYKETASQIAWVIRDCFPTVNWDATPTSHKLNSP